MTILGLHHAQVTIPPGEEEVARHFYIDLLGMQEIEKPEGLKQRGGFWLAVGPQEVHVSIEEADIDRAVTKAHLAYRVDDLDGLCTLLRANGIETAFDVPFQGYSRCHLRDPFGNRVELMQRIDR